MTCFHAFLIAAAAIGIHRILTFEDLFYPWRRWAARRPWTKPIACSACNPIWILLAVTAVALWVPEPWRWLILIPFAAYPAVRVFDRYSGKIIGPPPKGSPLAADPITPSKLVNTGSTGGCSSCGGSAAAAPVPAVVTEHNTVRGYARRFVLFTTFSNFRSSYSLVTAVFDQARMLAVDPSHLVLVWVNTTCDLTGLPPLPANVLVTPVVPPIPLPRDEVHEASVPIFIDQILPKLLVLGDATVIAHDLIFVADYLTIAAAIHRKLGTIPGFRWFHVCHSAPHTRPDQATPARLRSSLPEGHALICLAASQRAALAAYYGTELERVHVVPNARDLRTLWSASTRLSGFIRDHRLLEADIVQVFPVATDRMGMDGKRLALVAEVFAELARQATVRLVLVNAYANGNEGKIADLRAAAARAGLPPECLVLTSEAFPDLAGVGMPQEDVRILFQCSNLFIFPSLSEACSLTLMEASLAGCLLVLNDSLPSLFDIIPRDQCLTYGWGSLVEPVPADRMPAASTVASVVHEHLSDCVMNVTKRTLMRTHALEAVGAQLLAAVAP